MTSNTVLDVVVVGAGHAGLSASYYLTQCGLKHLVFERGNTGESWRSQRWDSFVLNTANGLNALPGNFQTGDHPEEFAPAAAFAAGLKAYAVKFQLPVKEHAEVISIDKPAGEHFFMIKVTEKDTSKNYQARQVVICSGMQNAKKIPPFAGKLSPGIIQLHASEFRNATQLPDGAVLVVGSGQSGCQIADGLAVAGRKVFLSTSMVPRVPRTYRGKDIMDWLIMTKFFDARKEDISELSILKMKPPQLTGTNGGKTTISLQALVRNGVVLLGKMENGTGPDFFFRQDAAYHVQFADEFSKKIKSMIDDFILKQHLDIPLPSMDLEDIPDAGLSRLVSLPSLNAQDENINSIIWTTGFNAGFNYIKLPVLDNDGNPVHQDGLSRVPGLYFLGLPWLRSRKSALIYGISDDASWIIDRVCSYAKRESVTMPRQEI